MKNTNILILLLLFLSCDIFAQYSIVDDDKVLNTKEMAQLEKVIDYQVTFYNNVLQGDVIKKTDVKLHIYTDYAAYMFYQKEQTGKTRLHSMGFYSSKNKEAVVCKDKNEKRFLSVCYHELNHFFVHTYFKSVPIWINEGLSSYFENFKVTSKKIKPQVNNTRLSRVKTMIDTRDIDLKDFVDWDRAKFYKTSFSQEGYGYALGYSIVQFLMQKDENLVDELLRQVADKKTSFEVIDSIYEGGFDKFENDFLMYIQKNG